ncbi:hypothetical protein [Beijerinckia sp. L45]|uniref:hypothetical protein n=1 Tax=Beijerinckia sp. L45 TaxID=1641855 RepID=UPI00131CFFC1|nr:hypothetical protein [Beijerinckia sp. L45]
MADDVKITFSADISELQKGLADAASAVAATTSTLQSGAAQINASFAALGQAYAAGMAQRLDSARSYSDDELAIARSGDKAQTDIALNGIKERQSAVKEQAQLSQMSREQELAALLQLESQREQLERSHLTFLQSTYADNAVAFANVQRQIDELASQSALKRQDIERSVNQQIYADYRRTFEQAGSSVSSSIMGMIKGQETLRQAVSNVLLSIIQSFIQARIRSVADWAAGVATQTATTTAGEATKTGAVVAGTAARSSAASSGAAADAASTVLAIGKSIVASAAETFAGIFGFLSPLLGPAAAGPAMAGQATVLAAGAALPSFATGAWSLPADMIAQVHQGEMIVPAGPAARMRDAAGASTGGDVHVHHATHFNVTAMDSRDVKRFFNGNGKAILGAINDSVRNGAHLGLSKLRSPLGT